MVGVLRAFIYGSLSVVLAGCSSGGHKGPGGPALNDSAQYLSALKLAENGACAETLPQLRCMAARGPGFEGPQYVLGFCLMEEAASAPEGENWNAEGMAWITRAADAGWGAAQAQLVHLYTDGVSVPRDVAKAQTWRLIHDDNPMRISLGLPELDSAAQVSLERLLDDGVRGEAQANADAWRRSPGVAAETTDEKFQSACRDLLKGGEAKEHSSTRPGPGNGPGNGKRRPVTLTADTL